MYRETAEEKSMRLDMQHPTDTKTECGNKKKDNET